ncbi:MAG: 30S ribosomal protein S8 [Candidatus Auribacterota bacterium]|jgi:small subunit ribosomal protein S8|uniref:Small ribosomal subunit protein uS8 n=1 Tax=Candidatus Auribacter fodinae TaxID=2093366 RepID=A0A3A4RA43_9BACT|nr:MAG: 30S ribosomal protein S8 [Candidatus Auribacter fodinae]
MSMTDPIADFLTRIRNANSAQHKEVDIPASKMKVEMARVLKEEGYIENYDVVESNVQGTIRVYLKYSPSNERIITKLIRVSKPGKREYTGTDNIPRVLGGLGIAILSTPKGILTDRQAKREHVGGEILCYVW